MNVESRFQAVLAASTEQLQVIDSILSGQHSQSNNPQSLRLWKLGEAAAEVHCSRVTIWRAIRDGRLRAVEIRPGTCRIPDAELRRWVGVSV
jgi:excisionase family DNA binding protein